MRDVFLKWDLDVRAMEVGKKHWQGLCAGGSMANMSPEGLGVSPAKHRARGGHRGWQRPRGRIHLLYEQWVPWTDVKLEDGQMTSAP